MVLPPGGGDDDDDDDYSDDDAVVKIIEPGRSKGMVRMPSRARVPRTKSKVTYSLFDDSDDEDWRGRSRSRNRFKGHKGW